MAGPPATHLFICRIFYIPAGISRFNRNDASKPFKRGLRAPETSSSKHGNFILHIISLQEQIAWIWNSRNDAYFLELIVRRQTHVQDDHRIWRTESPSAYHPHQARA